MATELVTTLGPRTAAEVGLVLPHEHVFVDFRLPGDPSHAVTDPAAVVALMAPEVAKARALGATVMVDCTPVGVGRRADIVKQVSEATGMPFVVPTGIYREPWVPEWAHAADESALADWMVSELEGEIGDTGVRAGWIKLSVGDDGITAAEAKILRAAARAGRQTGAVIGVHTKRGRVVRDQLDIIEAAGYAASRFIWIHAQNEPDVTLHLEMARRGAWLEYDGIGGGDDQGYVDAVSRALDAGLLEQVLLSQDRGWFDPAKPGGGEPKPFTYLVETFLPRLREAGIDGTTIGTLTCDNPFRAFAR